MSSRYAQWVSTLASFRHPRVITLFFFGFSAGIPLLLIFSSLSLWLREAGVDRATVTYFSWGALAFSFKFLWAPLIDRIPLPLLTRRLGRRRAWLITSQVAVAAAIVAMSQINPAYEESLIFMACAVTALGFAAATQDIVIDAYRIECADDDLQALLSSTYIAGYRIGMLVSGAGSLVLASVLGSTGEMYNYSAWQTTYLLMALTMGVGILTTLLINEPDTQHTSPYHYRGIQYARFLVLFFVGVAIFIGCLLLLSDTTDALANTLNAGLHNDALAGFLAETVRLSLGLATVAAVLKALSFTPLYEAELVQQSYLAPVQEFFQRYGKQLALLLLLFIGCYRISDIMLGVIANVFYEDIGFSKTEIAAVVKTFGLIMTITGGFLGGVLALRLGTIRVLYLGAILTVATNLLFMWLAYAGNDIRILYLVISADNLTAGLASAAFVAFLSRLTNVSFTAVQYAIFSSLMTLLPKSLGGYSGSMVETMGYPTFFLLASLLGLPVLLLIFLVQRHARFEA